jgi:hypothetical protein
MVKRLVRTVRPRLAGMGVAEQDRVWDDAVRAAFRGSGAVRIAAVSGSSEAAAAEAALAKEARSGANRGARIAFALLVLALAALLFEGFLSRFFSHASLERAGRSVGIVATVGRVRPRGGAACVGTQQSWGGTG